MCLIKRISPFCVVGSGGCRLDLLGRVLDGAAGARPLPLVVGRRGLGRGLAVGVADLRGLGLLVLVVGVAGRGELAGGGLRAAGLLGTLKVRVDNL